MINTSTAKGPLNEDRTSDDSSSKDTNSSNYIQDDEDDPFTFRSRKSYPQRNNRPKLNYRDLEKGLYDAHELRQSTWALGGPTLLEKNSRSGKTSNTIEYSDDEEEDMAANEENNEILIKKTDKSNDDSDQMHRRLWCICKKPWDHSRLMLRCDSCANWYHGDCIGVTKEQARVLDMNGDQFVCPPCKGVTSNSEVKSRRSSDESMNIKRKRLDAASPSDRKEGERNGNSIITKNLTNSEPLKRPKTGIFFQRDPVVEPQIHCIVHGCSNWAKSGWVYCSPACIRRHINETLQTIQRSKGMDNDIPATREDVLLYENRTKKVLDRKLVPKIEDLCTWINQHPSYEIVKPALRQSILLTANESKSSSNTGLVRQPSVVNPTTPKTPTTPTSTKPKLSWAPVVPNTKPVPIKKAPVQLAKPVATTSNAARTSSVQNYADIRMKVPQALYDKLIMRLEKSGEKLVTNDEMRILTDKIEEEMYRVYGKVDNAYKNKFRSLLANITNMNNNFFYKHLLSKEVTPKQIVAMKPEDMLPPEEKEKRKDDFEKEVQMIIKAEEQTAEEMARRARTKVTRQGLIDNDSVLPVYKTNEQNPSEMKETEPNSSDTSKTNRETTKTEKSTTSKTIVKTKKPISSTPGQKPAVKPKPKTQPIATSNKDATSTHGHHTFDINCSKCTNGTISKSTSPKPSPPMAPIVLENIPEPSEPIPTKTINEIPKPPSISPTHEEPSESSNPIFSSADLDNDYIEPESPTGIDALLYDDDDDLNNVSIHSRSSIVQQPQPQHSESPSDNNECLASAPQGIRDDYNPLAASKPKTDTTQIYQPTPIARSSSIENQWRGVILPPDVKIPCQSLRIYGESDYLIGDIPEQLGILGRLRLGDLWDYIRDSIAVRDVIILTLVSSNNNENNAFSRYVDTMRVSGRAAVINKRSEPSLIRDMYVLAADTKDCPPNVISTLALSTNTDPKQLFLVVIGSGKRTKSTNRPNQSQSLSSITYKPVSLQESVTARDPRLSRNKDPRLGGPTATETIPTMNPSPPTSQSMYTTNTKTIPTEYSTEDLVKLISDSFDHIRRASSLDAIRPIVMSTMELLKSSGREDLCTRFTNELHTMMLEENLKKETNVTSAHTDGDNLNEENMEVDEEQDDKQKKQLNISEFNDVDYRFLGQDMDHRIATTTAPENDHHNERRKDAMRKSRFSDVISSHRDADDRTVKSSLMIDERERKPTMIGNDLDFRTGDAKRLSPK
ncbi:unnamed protein product [Rotaria socialis]